MDDLIGALCILGLLLLFCTGMVGYKLGLKDGRNMIQKEAVKNSCAYWAPDADGTPKLVWGIKK